MLFNIIYIMRNCVLLFVTEGVAQSTHDVAGH